MTDPITIMVERLYGLPPLIIEDGLGMARFFFETDASAIGVNSYDAWIAAGPHDRFVRHDIEIVNGPMRGRSPYLAWEPLLSDPAPQ